MILLILTGGTIGSHIQKNGTINIGKSALLELYSKTDSKTVFETVEPINVLSENISPNDWGRLVSTLENTDTRKYEGIIIAHGSDTLAYTSALIGMLYSNARLPICLIAADLPPDDTNSNALCNMRAAVSMVKRGIRGVWTIYADDAQQKQIKVYTAARLMEADTYNDRFSCYGGEVFGYIDVKNGDFKPNSSVKISDTLFKNKVTVTSFKNKVLFIRPYPALDYSSIDIDGYSAVVHYSYHAGTACTVGYDTDLAVFAQRCEQAGTDLYFGSLKSPAQTLYASSAELLKYDITPVFNISPYAMYMKALIAYNQTQFPPKKLMAENLGHEVLPPRG